MLGTQGPGQASQVFPHGFVHRTRQEIRREPDLRAQTNLQDDAGHATRKDDPVLAENTMPLREARGSCLRKLAIAAAVFAIVVLLYPKHKRWVHPEIDGFVVDAERPGERIEGANVKITNSEYTEKSATTNEEGRFRLGAVSAREYSFPGDTVKWTELVITHEDYASRTVRISISGADLIGENEPPRENLRVEMVSVAR